MKDEEGRGEWETGGWHKVAVVRLSIRFSRGHFPNRNGPRGIKTSKSARFTRTKILQVEPSIYPSSGLGGWLPDGPRRSVKLSKVRMAGVTNAQILW
jgi:hypothetical protein